MGGTDRTPQHDYFGRKYHTPQRDLSGLPPLPPTRTWRRRQKAYVLSALVVATAVVFWAVTSTRAPAPQPRTYPAVAAKLAVKCDEARLDSCLENMPDGMSQSVDPWGSVRDPNAAQFVGQYYPASNQTAVVQSLQQDGLQAIAHEDWLSDTNNADIVVLRFASAQGADAGLRSYLQATIELVGSDKGKVEVPGIPGYAYPFGELDGAGEVNTWYAASVGNLLMIIAFQSPGSFNRNYFAKLAVGEYQSLRTAKIPATASSTPATE